MTRRQTKTAQIHHSRKFFFGMEVWLFIIKISIIAERIIFLLLNILRVEVFLYLMLTLIWFFYLCLYVRNVLICLLSKLDSQKIISKICMLPYIECCYYPYLLGNSWAAGGVKAGRGLFLKEQCPISTCALLTSRYIDR